MLSHRDSTLILPKRKKFSDLETYAAFQELFDAVDRSLLPSKLNAKQRVRISLDGPSSSIFYMDITKNNDKPFYDVPKYYMLVKHSILFPVTWLVFTLFAAI